MKKKKVFSYLLFLICTTTSLANNKTIKEVVFSGNNKYSDFVYKQYINDIKVGDNFTEKLNNDIIKNLFATDYIDDVKIDFNNGILNINIKEKIFISKITFNGAKKLKDDVINQHLKLKVKEIFSSKLLNEDLDFIKNFYKSIGYFNTKIDYEIKQIDNGLVEVIFNVKEGKKPHIGNIYFIGNNSFRSRILKEELFSRENAFYKFGRRINYNSDILEYDAYLLKMFYLAKGYIDFEVNSVNATFNKEKNEFDIIFDLNEGNKYSFDKFDIIDNIGIGDDIEYIKNKLIIVKEGDVFNIKKVNESIDKINNYLIKKDNRFFIVNMQILPNKIFKNVKVNFIIDKTEKFYIGQIKIKNNIRTSDNVIRQQLLIKEGDPLNENNIERSIQKVRNLGFFKTVNYKKTAGMLNNQFDIIIDVEEQSTGSLNFGIGYNSSYGLNGNIGINQKNLFGNGNSVNFDVNINRYNNNFYLGFAKPNFLGTNILTGANIFYQDINNVDNSDSNLGYNRSEKGVRTFFSFNITEYLSHTIDYSFSISKVNDVSSDYDGILSNRDDKISEISLNFSYDRRDNRYNTTKGYLLSYDISFAGLFGTKDYLKHILYASYYYPLYLDKLILKIEGKFATIGSINNNPLFPDDGFYLGGYNMRGFESGGIGPRVKGGRGTKTDNYGLSGTDLYYFNAEIKFPLFLPKEFAISGVLFYNIGKVTGVEDNESVDKTLIEDSNTFRSAAGISILWQTAIGNLSFDFSKVIKKESYDISENFRFNIGTNF